MSAGQNDLVTLAQAYAWLQLTPGSDDANLQSVITSVSQLIATWCSRNFVKADYVEGYDGVCTSRLTLRNWPIISVASVSIDGQLIPAATTPTSTGFLADKRRTIGLVGYRFSRGFQNIAVAYTAGYEEIPADLQMACLQWVGVAYASASRDLSVASEKAGDTEIKYAVGGPTIMIGGSAVPMPASVYAVLSQYRDVVPV